MAVAAPKVHYKLSEDLQNLHLDAQVILYILHLSKLNVPGLGDFHFHSGLNRLGTPVIWQGVPYEPFLANFSGMEITGRGKANRPTMTLGNTTGLITGLAGSYNDLVGIQLTRIRTMRRYLDAANFAQGNPQADPNVEFPRDVFFIQQRLRENPVQVDFSLGSPLDLDGVELPARQIVRNLCTWEYKGDGCFYANQNGYFDSNDNRTGDPRMDQCSKRLSGCKCRFGENGQLPFSSFPALTLI